LGRPICAFTRLAVVAQELVHDVRILVTKKHAQFQTRRLRDPRHGGQFAIHIAAPRLRDRQYFGRAIRLRSGLLKERQVFDGQRRALIVALEFIDVHGRLGQKIRVGEPLRVAGWSDNGCSSVY
jgi:hypothetical protein